MGLLAPDPQPGAERQGVLDNALAVLHEHGFAAAEVFGVDSDAILYRNAGRCMTAWLRWTGGRLIVISESGWPAEPAGWVLRRLDAS